MVITLKLNLTLIFSVNFVVKALKVSSTGCIELLSITLTDCPVSRSTWWSSHTWETCGSRGQSSDRASLSGAWGSQLGQLILARVKSKHKFSELP